MALQDLPFEAILKTSAELTGPIGAIAAGALKYFKPSGRRATKAAERLLHVQDYTEKYSEKGDLLMEAGFASITGRVLLSADEIRLGLRKVFPSDFFRVYADCRSYFVPNDRMIGKLTPVSRMETPQSRGAFAYGFLGGYVVLAGAAGVAFSFGLPYFYKSSDWTGFVGTILFAVGFLTLGFSCINQARRIADVTRVLEWPDQPQASSTDTPLKPDQPIIVATLRNNGGDTSPPPPATDAPPSIN